MLLMVVTLLGGVILFQAGRASGLRAEAVTGADAAALGAANNIGEQLVGQLGDGGGMNLSAVTSGSARAAADRWAAANGAQVTEFSFDVASSEVRVEVVSSGELDGDGGMEQTAGEVARARAAAEIIDEFDPDGELDGMSDLPDGGEPGDDYVGVNEIADEAGLEIEDLVMFEGKLVAW